MNVRFVTRAARVLLAAGTIAAGVGVATPAHANLCSPQPTPTVAMGATKGLFHEHESTTVGVSLRPPGIADPQVNGFRR